MARKRRRLSADFKAKVALEAVKGEKTVAASWLASTRSMATRSPSGRSSLLEALPEVFGRRRDQEAAVQQELVNELYQQIGQLKVELDWLKKVGLSRLRSVRRGKLALVGGLSIGGG